MVQLELVFVLQLVTGILILVLLLRINEIKKQLDGVIQEVQKYVDFIIAGEESEEQLYNIEETVSKSEKKYEKVKKESFQNAEIKQNHLIQSVLEEYFP